jgi:16S rRNA (cytosine967-C5)-methyltransferase
LAKKYSARASAARIINDVIQHQRSLNAVLAHELPHLAENERSLCQQLCYGVLRWYPQLTALTQQLIKKPLKKKDGDIHSLLLCGLYQLRSMRIPEHAALSETVNATKTLGKQWAKGFVNASLRNYQREQETFDKTLMSSLSAQYAHPGWMIEQIQQQWPEEWEAVLNENNQHAPMILRVNQQHNSADSYLKKLSQAEIKATKINGVEHAILLDSPCDVFSLPGFEHGEVSVQDGAAQLVITLLDIQPDQRILDACAAPGGKTCHILESNPQNNVTALDIDPLRLEQIKQNTDRLSLNATLIAADAGNIDAWWKGEKFDRILIDAPCSGTGVIRRHPDIKVLRKPDDITSLVEKQRQLLNNLWPLLNPGGLMVYTTCSIFKQENELQVSHFLEQHPEAEEHHIEPEPGLRRDVGYQRLPGTNHLDGFYYACLRHR